MRNVPAPGSPARSGLLGVLKSWLRFWSIETRNESPGRRPKTAGLNAHRSGSVQVLVVDDNPLNLMLMSALMRPRGLVPWLASDGAEAVALANELRFDLILMDLQMPILDGLGATAAIRRFENSCARPAVPVIAFSSALPGARVLAAHGMTGSLAKPCDDQELEDCLVRWCPTYHAEPSARGVPSDTSRWRAMKRTPGAQRAWSR